MGFMQGFGKSFSNSFENAQSRRAVKERDAFQVAYDSFTRNSTQYEADKKADEALINSAKTLVSQAGLPEEAWGEAYKRLKAGFTVEKTDEWLRTNKFTVTPATDAPDEAAAPSTVDGEMEQLGQVDPASATTDPTMSGDENGGLLSEQAETATGAAPVAPEGVDQANSEVAQAAGVTPEQMAQYDQGYQSPPLPTGVSIETIQAIQDPLVEFGLEDGITDAKLAAAKVRADQFRNSDDPNLQAAAARFDAIIPSIDAALATEGGELDPKLLIDLMKPSGDLRADIRNQATATQTLASIGLELDTMAKETPEVLTMTGTGVSGAVSIANEVNTLFSMIGQMGNEGADENAVVSAVKDWEAKLLAQGVPKEIAVQQAQFAALQVRFIYAAGKAMGQQGNGFSNYDFDNIMKSINASNGYPAYSQNLRRLVGERTTEVQNMIDTAVDSTEIQVAIQSNDQLGQLLMTELTAMDDRLDPKVVEWMNAPVTGAAPGDNMGGGTITTDPDYTLKSDPNADATGAPPNAIPITDELIGLYPEVFSGSDKGRSYIQNEDGTITVY